MYCWKCGKELHQDARFCSFCGAEQKPAAAQPAAEAPKASVPSAAEPVKTTPPPAQPVQKPAQPSAAPSAAANQANAQEPEKKTWKNYLYLALTALFIYLAIDNINCMNSGKPYTVLFDVIPVQYILIPGAIIIFIGGIVSNSKKK